MPFRQATPETADARGRRKLLGAWYTPQALVDHVVGLTVRADLNPVTVLDPACGDGRFLSAVRDAARGHVRLTGVDVDPDAVVSARAALPEAEIIEADALAME